MRYLLFLLAHVFFYPCFSQKTNPYVLVGFGIGSHKDSPVGTGLGERYAFGIQRALNNNKLRIEPSIRYANYRTSPYRSNTNGKIRVRNVNLNLQYDFIRVGYTSMVIGTGVGYQSATGHQDLRNAGREETTDISHFSHKGFGANTFLGMRFRPIKTPVGIEIILYEINYAFRPKTYEVGLLNLRLIYQL